MLDITFEATFKRIFVYNILFEDADVDAELLNLNEKSRVVGISAAGCGLASMLRFSPERIDAIDINNHHLALAALKMTAARDLQSHGLLYQMLGFGQLSGAERSIRRLSLSLPGWMQEHWKKHHNIFEKGLYSQGLTATLLSNLREAIGLGSGWMFDFVQRPAEERARAIRGLVEPVLRKPLIEGLLRSPLQQLALGINFSQRDRLLDTPSKDIVEFMVQHLERVAQTDLENNWFAWLATAGHFNHDSEGAVPPYLRREAHALSRQADTRFVFHHDNFLATLRRAPHDHWTHFSLCDFIDWLPMNEQIKVFNEVLRTAEPGAKVLFRSVQSQDVIAGLGLSENFKWQEEPSLHATKNERSCQYRRVDLFEVVK